MIDKFIFAIDPSINNVGWAHLFCHENQLTLLDCGIFHNNLEILLDKMNFIYQSVREKIQGIHVDAIVVEETLVNINPFTSLKLSKGQCSAIAGAFGQGFPVYIYSCKSPRKALLNDGNAKKKQCRQFIENIVGKVANEHIADAVLLGYYHHYKQMNPHLLNTPSKKTKKKITPKDPLDQSTQRPKKKTIKMDQSSAISKAQEETIAIDQQSISLNPESHINPSKNTPNTKKKTIKRDQSKGIYEAQEEPTAIDQQSISLNPESHVNPSKNTPTTKKKTIKMDQSSAISKAQEEPIAIDQQSISLNPESHVNPSKNTQRPKKKTVKMDQSKNIYEAQEEPIPLTNNLAP